MYNSELNLEDVPNRIGEDGEDDAWSDLAQELTDGSIKSPHSDTSVTPLTLPIVNVRGENLSSGQSQSDSKGLPGTKGDPSKSQPVEAGQEAKPRHNAEANHAIDLLIPGLSVAKFLVPGARAAAKAGEAGIKNHVVASAEKAAFDTVKALEDAAKKAQAGANAGVKAGEAAIKKNVVAPSEQAAIDTVKALEDAAKKAQAGANAGAKAGEAAIKKNVVAPAEKAAIDTVRALDDAAKKLEDAAADAAKKAADEFNKKAQETRKALDDGLKKGADEAAKALDFIFGKQKR